MGGKDTKRTDLCMKVENSLGSLKTLSLSSWLTITLLAVIAAMLIAPDIDPPDTILQGGGAPVAIHFVSHHSSHGTQQARAITSQEFGKGLSLSAGSRSRASDVAVLTTNRRVLRC